MIEIRSDNFDIWEKSFSKLSTFLSQFIMDFILSNFFYLATINLNNKCWLIIPLSVSKIEVEYQTSLFVFFWNTYFYWLNYLFMNIRRLWMQHCYVANNACWVINFVKDFEAFCWFAMVSSRNHSLCASKTTLFTTR